MRILITGGAGCLGSSLVERYIKDFEILVIDNFATGKREVVPDVSGLTVVEGSVGDSELVSSQINSFKPEIVIHSAAAYKDPSNWVEDVETNVVGSINIAKACLSGHVKKVINFQSALCYGRPMVVPIPVDSPTSPFTSYGISKTAGEKYLLESGLNVVSLRLANICGPRLAIGPIPTFYMRLREDKPCFCSDSIRDFLDMEDFLSLMDMLIQNDFETGVYNVSTGKGNSIKEVFDAVVQYLGIPSREVPIKPVGDDDVKEVVLDPSETEKVFEWSAQHGFGAIINRQLSWYEKHGVSAIYSHLTEPK